ncbi:substrate-binding domain-containing protein [Caballeronia sp. LZ062]|uniref:substrate-binding domain-containing protein n=1 Tax=unclassified Caballeronia TaxID=2646786 RepID=UPI002865445A|nr:MULTISPECIES: substrate-binding domain-containing protein [unclassified Caballeronia]MDR5855108.1 substrate-binding domain-containing protein [Caballeronia sp. LZ050]MDR5870362.1 substrate-binding domain-containing protein [Caballeronia sp. LZ062]
MVDVTCRAELILRDPDGRETSLSAVVPLLQLVAQTGSIANAASAKGLSYRHAWGLLREIEARLGGALITKSRGRGSVLSELGESVLRAQRLCGDRLEAPLQAVAADVADELNRRLAGEISDLRIHASHGYAVATLVRALGERRVPVDIKYRESAEAVRALARSECELAGFHLPIGEFRSTCAEIYRPYLDPKKHQLIRLTRRTQGLFLPKGNPKHITGLRDLARSDVRFVNRQPGSGTRMLLDLSLRGVGVDPDEINGYASTELTHSAIAAFVASGMADLGFGVKPAAQHFGLDFIPIIDEDYFFACERARLDEQRLVSVLGVLRSAAFNESVAHLGGYDPQRCGALVEVDEGLRG